jgi:hypothetical protein
MAMTHIILAIIGLRSCKYGLVEASFSWSFAGLWIWKQKLYITVWYSNKTAVKRAQTTHLSKNNL